MVVCLNRLVCGNLVTFFGACLSVYPPITAAGDVRHERRLPQGVWRRDLGAMRDERARAEARENGREIAGVSLFAILPLLGWACARGAGFVARGRQLLR